MWLRVSAGLHAHEIGCEHGISSATYLQGEGQVREGWAIEVNWSLSATRVRADVKAGCLKQWRWLSQANWPSDARKSWPIYDSSNEP